MRIKYNRVSTAGQSGQRFSVDTEGYDLTLMDRVSGSVSFRDREGGRQVMALVESGELKELVVEELSRLGRNVGDVIQTLEWLDANGVNVRVRNIGLESRPDGHANPIWKMISSVMSSLYEMERTNITERTRTGRMVAVQRGVRMGRPKGTRESPRQFLEKRRNREIVGYLNRGMSYSEIARLLNCSKGTVVKVKKMLAECGQKQ